MTADLHDAMLWEPADGGAVRCDLCAHRCRIAEGKFGSCRVRQNVDGVLKTLTYGQLCATHVDPIEKKPLFHFLPGSLSLSIATPGCNFRCSFCQNWRISQQPREDDDDGLSTPSRQNQFVPPEQIVQLARRNGCQSISYTYTEPTIFFELAYDTAHLAHEQGIKNCFVSNGFMTAEAVETVAPVLDAINVDLKCFSDETYKNVCGGRLQPVLDCLENLVRAGVWVEVTTLVVPGMNDSEAELRRIAEFIATRLGAHVPWHVSRFHGDYKQRTTPATPLSTLQTACRLGAEAGLKYIYSGNVPGEADERTYCARCREVLIDRMGFSVQHVHLQNGACPKCDTPLEGVWE
ncbi:MAG: AmmeMemoRadiSam system radical SAM enzyme [Phycisphaerae bacterium]|nr:AmmeMemoRadiSam system radical SAM enzyme [Phycisphaerae bacterium]